MGSDRRRRQRVSVTRARGARIWLLSLKVVSSHVRPAHSPKHNVQQISNTQSLFQPLDKGIERCLARQAPSTGLEIFRIAFGIVILQEICFLGYFRHLIFDSVPYLVQSSPVIPVALLLWGLTAIALILGICTRAASVANYLFWIGFVTFTPLWHDFDGGFDQLMTGTSFLLMFAPIGRCFSFDRLLWKLRNNIRPGSSYSAPTVPILVYYLIPGISLGLLYLDAGIHKLFADFWVRGLGAWLPSTMPYYYSPVDLSLLLNIKPLQQLIGYTLIAFQFSFLFLFHRRFWRIPVLFFGTLFHLGIVISLNIVPYGIGMLAHYLLLIPFRWWRSLGRRVQLNRPARIWEFDINNPTSRQLAIIVEHFDIMKHYRFIPADSKKKNSGAYSSVLPLDRNDALFSCGTDRSSEALNREHKRTLLKGILFFTRLIQTRSPDQKNATRNRSGSRMIKDVFYPTYDTPTHRVVPRIRIFILVVAIFQLNTTAYYGFFGRFGIDMNANPFLQTFKLVSNTLTPISHVFLGITPHALYMDDHFSGYDRILAIGYRNDSGMNWLPFVNPEGRFEFPNWGRVHSMWANVAVRPAYDLKKLKPYLQRVIIFWGTRKGLNLSETHFYVLEKTVNVDPFWEKDRRLNNSQGPWTIVKTARWDNEVKQLFYVD